MVKDLGLAQRQLNPKSTNSSKSCGKQKKET